MSAEQLATRLLSEEARISGDRIRRGDIGQKDFDKFVQVSREIASLPIQIDDTPAITMSALRTRCRRLKRTKGLALVIVDYLQLMRPAAGTQPESRVLEISMITQGLKALAKELAVPVLALSQLSRQVENRDDKRPQLSDLRESGSIEQDADAVMFVYRDEYYLEQKMPKEIAFEGSGDKFNAAMDEWQQRDGEGAQPGRSDHRQAAPRSHRLDPAAVRGRVHPLRRSRPRPFRLCRVRPRGWTRFRRGGDTALRFLTSISGPSSPTGGAARPTGPAVRRWSRPMVMASGGPVSPALYAAGCRHFFVAYLNEALAIRDVVPGAMLAVLGGLIPGTEDEYVAHDLTPVLGSLDEIARWRRLGQAARDPARRYRHVPARPVAARSRRSGRRSCPAGRDSRLCDVASGVVRDAGRSDQCRSS